MASLLVCTLPWKKKRYQVSEIPEGTEAFFFKLPVHWSCWTNTTNRGRGGAGMCSLKGRCSVAGLECVSAMFLQHWALMEELNRSKKDFEAILQAKNRELEQTKVLARRWRFRIWLVHATQHFQQCKGCYGEWRERICLFPASGEIIRQITQAYGRLHWRQHLFPSLIQKQNAREKTLILQSRLSSVLDALPAHPSDVGLWSGVVRINNSVSSCL